MKKNIHPVINNVIFRDTEAGVDFMTRSVLTSDTKETHDGKEYQIITIEVSSASHPFYTGSQRIMDTQGRVEKFKARQEKTAKRKVTKKSN